MPCSAEFRDPTQPAYPLPPTDDAPAGIGGNTELVLSAIWISSQSRRATINGIIAKQGQTIEIKQNPTLNPKPANSSTAGNKENERINNTLPPALNQSNGTTNTGTSRPAPENNADLLEKMAGPMGSLIAPPFSSATESMDTPPLQGQNTLQQANTAQRPVATSHTAQPPASTQSSNTVPKQVRSSTIKIIGIHKNSVTIDQDGERKTLQLVQRPYKTQ
jgi:hypothetical protein